MFARRISVFTLTISWLALCRGGAQENSVVAKDTKCPSYGIPVCGTRDKDYFIFANQCVLSELNKDLEAGEKIFKKIPLKHCIEDCELECPNVYEPVCALDIHTQQRQLFVSRCSLVEYACRKNIDFLEMKTTDCESMTILTTSQKALEKRSKKGKRRPVPCSRIFKPVCGSYYGVKSTFKNECLLNAENIKFGKAWTIVKYGICDEDNLNTRQHIDVLPQNKVHTIKKRSYNQNNYVNYGIPNYSAYNMMHHNSRPSLHYNSQYYPRNYRQTMEMPNAMFPYGQQYNNMAPTFPTANQQDKFKAENVINKIISTSDQFVDNSVNSDGCQSNICPSYMDVKQGNNAMHYGEPFNGYARKYQNERLQFPVQKIEPWHNHANTFIHSDVFDRRIPIVQEVQPMEYGHQIDTSSNLYETQNVFDSAQAEVQRAATKNIKPMEMSTNKTEFNVRFPLLNKYTEFLKNSETFGNDTSEDSKKQEDNKKKEDSKMEEDSKKEEGSIKQEDNQRLLTTSENSNEFSKSKMNLSQTNEIEYQSETPNSWNARNWNAEAFHGDANKYQDGEQQFEDKQMEPWNLHNLPNTDRQVQTAQNMYSTDYDHRVSNSQSSFHDRQHNFNTAQEHDQEVEATDHNPMQLSRNKMDFNYMFPNVNQYRNFLPTIRSEQRPESDADNERDVTKEISYYYGIVPTSQKPTQYYPMMNNNNNRNVMPTSQKPTQYYPMMNNNRNVMPISQKPTQYNPMMNNYRNIMPEQIDTSHIDAYEENNINRAYEEDQEIGATDVRPLKFPTNNKINFNSISQLDANNGVVIPKPPALPTESFYNRFNNLASESETDYDKIFETKNPNEMAETFYPQNLINTPISMPQTSYSAMKTFAPSQRSEEMNPTMNIAYPQNLMNTFERARMSEQEVEMETPNAMPEMSYPQNLMRTSYSPMNTFVPSQRSEMEMKPAENENIYELSRATYPQNLMNTFERAKMSEQKVEIETPNAMTEISYPQNLMRTPISTPESPYSPMNTFAPSQRSEIDMKPAANENIYELSRETTNIAYPQNIMNTFTRTKLSEQQVEVQTPNSMPETSYSPVNTFGPSQRSEIETKPAANENIYEFSRETTNIAYPENLMNTFERAKMSEPEVEPATKENIFELPNEMENNISEQEVEVNQPNSMPATSYYPLNTLAPSQRSEIKTKPAANENKYELSRETTNIAYADNFMNTFEKAKMSEPEVKSATKENIFGLPNEAANNIFEIKTSNALPDTEYSQNLLNTPISMSETSYPQMNALTPSQKSEIEMKPALNENIYETANIAYPQNLINTKISEHELEVEPGTKENIFEQMANIAYPEDLANTHPEAKNSDSNSEKDVEMQPPVEEKVFETSKLCELGESSLCAVLPNGNVQTFDNICEMMNSNMNSVNTWTKLHDGRCDNCKVNCNREYQPICVQRNGVNYTMVNECYYNMGVCIDKISKWQKISNGECQSYATIRDKYEHDKPGFKYTSNYFVTKTTTEISTDSTTRTPISSTSTIETTTKTTTSDNEVVIKKTATNKNELRKSRRNKSRKGVAKGAIRRRSSSPESLDIKRQPLNAPISNFKVPIDTYIMNLVNSFHRT